MPQEIRQLWREPPTLRSLGQKWPGRPGSEGPISAPLGRGAYRVTLKVSDGRRTVRPVGSVRLVGQGGRQLSEECLTKLFDPLDVDVVTADESAGLGAWWEWRDHGPFFEPRQMNLEQRSAQREALRQLAPRCSPIPEQRADDGDADPVAERIDGLLHQRRKGWSRGRGHGRRLSQPQRRRTLLDRLFIHWICNISTERKSGCLSPPVREITSLSRLPGAGSDRRSLVPSMSAFGGTTGRQRGHRYDTDDLVPAHP